MLSSSCLISRANRTRSDIDQVLQTLSGEDHVTSRDQDHVTSRDQDHVTMDPGSATTAQPAAPNCAVEVYHDLDHKGHQRSAFEVYGGCDDVTEGQAGASLMHSYTQLIDDKCADEESPISSIWESRWLDHAALVGRVMAQDKVDQETNTLPCNINYNFSSDTLELLKSPSKNELDPNEQDIAPPPRGGCSRGGAPQFRCKNADCQAAFPSATQRWYHYKAVHEEIQLQCPECSKIFVKLQQLDVHLRSHLKMKMFKCPTDGCGKSFLTQQQCNNHKLIHTGEKHFECSECNTWFREKNTLIRHRRTHTKIKLYRCETCHKSFSYASSLNVHRKHFHPTSSIIEDSSSQRSTKPSKRIRKSERSKKNKQTD